MTHAIIKSCAYIFVYSCTLHPASVILYCAMYSVGFCYWKDRSVSYAMTCTYLMLHYLLEDKAIILLSLTLSLASRGWSSNGICWLLCLQLNPYFNFQGNLKLSDLGQRAFLFPITWQQNPNISSQTQK